MPSGPLFYPMNVIITVNKQSIAYTDYIYFPHPPPDGLIFTEIHQWWNENVLDDCVLVLAWSIAVRVNTQAIQWGG